MIIKEGKYIFQKNISWQVINNILNPKNRPDINLTLDISDYPMHNISIQINTELDYFNRLLFEFDSSKNTLLCYLQDDEGTTRNFRLFVVNPINYLINTFDDYAIYFDHSFECTDDEYKLFNQCFSKDNDFMSLELYTNTSEPIVANKQLTLVDTIFGIFKEPFNIISPVIIINRSEIINFNYIKIPKLNRYYFIKNYTILSYNTYELYLEEDVLVTYLDLIKNCKGMINRNETKYNPLIPDKQMIAECGNKIIVSNINNELMNNIESVESPLTYAVAGYDIDAYIV